MCVDVLDISIKTIQNVSEWLWKKAEVLPYYKKEDWEQVQNYFTD